MSRKWEFYQQKQDMKGTECIKAMVVHVQSREMGKQK